MVHLQNLQPFGLINFITIFHSVVFFVYEQRLPQLLIVPPVELVSDCPNLRYVWCL